MADTFIIYPLLFQNKITSCEQQSQLFTTLLV